MDAVTTPWVEIRTCPEHVASVPPWFAEVVVLARHFTQRGYLATISQHLRLARRRAGTFEVLDFVAILLGYAVSGEPTLEAFFDRLAPFAQPFMALFGRNRLPHRSTLSRFLAAIDPSCLQALRQLFQDDLFQQGCAGAHLGGFLDRHGQQLVVFDVDGTRQAARQRALITTSDLPRPWRRMDAVCAPGYTGRQRGEVVRTRTTVLQAHTQEWLGTFAGPGNGDYMEELVAACQSITAYLAARNLSPSQALIRLDGLYGTIGLLARLQPFQLGFLTRGRDYTLLDHATVQARLQQPSDVTLTHPETQVQREVFDVGWIADWLPERPDVPISYRVILTRCPTPLDRTQISVGKLRGEYVYELFLTSHPTSSLPPATIVELYQHRGAFEQVLSDEDAEQDCDRWCSRTPCGQEFWQILSQWVWNTRLALGRVAQPQPLRWTTWEAGAAAPLAPTSHEASREREDPAAGAVASDPDTGAVPPGAAGSAAGAAVLVPTYGPLTLAKPWATARRQFSALDFTVQADDTLVCPAGKVLRLRERRVQANGDLRVLYAPQTHTCRTCQLAEACLGRDAKAGEPRRVSGVRPLVGWQLAPTVASDPPVERLGTPQLDADQRHVLQWGDVGGRRVRRDLVTHLRRQQVTITRQEIPPAPVPASPRVWTRAERAHRRQSWANRLARNACNPQLPAMTVTVCGIAPPLAAYLGLPSSPAP